MKITKDKVSAILRTRWEKFKGWRAERKDRCVLYRIYEDYTKGCIVRHRDRKFHRSDLPPCAVPVTGERNAYAVVYMEAPPPAPYGQNAISLFIWSEDYSFEKSFEHFSTDGNPLDWKRILIVGGVVVVGIYMMYVTGVVG
ncbi:MAG: hypothetical protein IKY16_10780 [Bacteroidales bacterium]|nr:hypothetical protein [Bacteroidales bacterium]